MFKSNLFFIFVLLRQIVYKVGGAHHRALHLWSKQFSQGRWRVVGHNMFDLTGSRFELPTFRSRDKVLLPDQK